MNLGLPVMGTTTNNPEHSYLSGNLSPRSKKKANSSLLLSSPMSSSRKQKKKKRRREQLSSMAIEAPSLYTQDIGSEGIKTKPVQLSGPGHNNNFNVVETKDEKRRRRQRMERFGVVEKKRSEEPDLLSSSLSSSRGDGGTSKASMMVLRRNEANQTRVVGTSTALEKPYLRLTTHAKPEDVRPLPVLIRCLAHIKNEFIKNEDFEWTNEQMKSLRQDLTVQGIKNKFVLEVYETHARILLENGDLDEFHQCESVIRSLTSSHHHQDSEKDLCIESDDARVDDDDESDNCLNQSEESADEFQAYHILYNLVRDNWGELTRSLTDTNNEYLETSPNAASSNSDSDKQAAAAHHHGTSRRHAFKVVQSVVHDDYQGFFRLYETAPHMSAYLMDFLVRRVRDGAYERIVSAYRPTLSVEHFREALHFDDLEETRRFLKKSKAAFMQEQGGPPFYVDCKSSAASLPTKK